MKRLPSGNYNTQVRINGRVVSVTGRSAAEVKQKVAELRCRKNDSLATRIDFKTAIDNLLDAKSSVLSANTMKGYKTISRNLFPLYEKDVSSITQMDVQKFINDYNKSHSAHSTINAYSFLMTVIKSVRSVDFQIKLPQKKRTDIPFPNMNEVDMLISNAKDKDLANAIRLAVFATMRRGEICALKYADLSDGMIHVHATITQDDGYEYKDTPKSVAGDRYISVPEELLSLLGKGKKDEYVIGLTPESLYMKYRRLLKRLGLPAYSFHSLRRTSASWLHDMGKSDSWIMKRGGWETPSCLISVYRKTMQDDSDVLNAISSRI